MISTKNPGALPDPKKLKQVCKAVSVLDAILSQDWEYRYYSYNSKWGDGEECCEVRNGSGDHMLVLFCEDGCIINGFAHEYKQPDKSKVTKDLPTIFSEFIHGEPVRTIGTTFCIWHADGKWRTGEIENYDDCSEEMLSVFDGEPKTYKAWAEEYFEESYKETGIPLETIKGIYGGQTLTEAMVLSIVDELKDWEQLQSDMEEIQYSYSFNRS